MSSLDYAQYIDLAKVKPGFAVPFNTREIDGSFVVANDFGDLAFLSPDELRAFIEGDVAPSDPLYETLKTKNLLLGELDIPAQAARYARTTGLRSSLSAR